MTVIEERNVVNDVVAVNETPAEDITLIFIICVKRLIDRGLVYRSSYSYSSYFVHRYKALLCVRAYSSGKYTYHLSFLYL